MKILVLNIISLYQAIISPLIKQALGTSKLCRYTPSCSEYAKEAVQKHGVLTGLSLSFRRFLTCQPFVKPYESY